MHELVAPPSRVQQAALLFARHGVAVFDGVLPAHVCAALASELAINGSHQREVVNGKLRSDTVGDPNGASLRWNRAQSPGRGVVGALLRLVAQHLGAFLVAALGARAEEVDLLECGSIISYPGAPAQTWCAAPPPHYTLYPGFPQQWPTAHGRHADSDLHNACEATTVVLQLQLVDMDSSLGPIEVRPFVPLDTEQVDIPMLLKAGSVVAYDSKVWHRGGANLGNEPRPVLYTTWMATDDGLLPRNMGYTIEHAEMGAWTLARLQERENDDPRSPHLDSIISGLQSVPIEVAFAVQ